MGWRELGVGKNRVAQLAAWGATGWSEGRRGKGRLRAFGTVVFRAATPHLRPLLPRAGGKRLGAAVGGGLASRARVRAGL